MSNDERVQRYAKGMYGDGVEIDGEGPYYNLVRYAIEVADAEQAALRRGAKTLGEILDRTLRDALNASGVNHIIDETGDGDWELVWERLAELRPRLEAAERALADERASTFAEVSHAMNLVADIWERDGSDPCRVRITREYANAYRLYAEGHGAPTGSAKFRAALAGPAPETTERS